MISKIFTPIKTALKNNFILDGGDWIFLIVLLIGFIGCFIALSTVMNGNRKFKIGKTFKSFFWLLMIGAVTGLLGWIPMERGSGWWFLLCFAISIGWGMLLVRNLFRKKKWSDRESFLPELLYLICGACIGGIGFYLIFNAFNQQNLHTAFTFNAFAVVIPWLVLKSHEYWQRIPEPMYNFWVYDKFATKPSFANLQTIFMTVELSPTYHAKDAPPQIPIQQNANLPIQASLGKFFQKFFMDYNSKEENDPIYDLDVNGLGEPIAWVFYYYPDPYIKKRRYLDPHLSIHQNEVKVMHSTIYADRIIRPESTGGIRIIG